MLYQDHYNKWRKCKLCGLCNNRTLIVLGKGKIPCDVLFIGEAPGDSEDVLGMPFVGPAGFLLDRTIRAAELESYRLAFTNLVCCIPKEDGEKRDPDKKEIAACSKRLKEFIEIARPKSVVLAGKLSKKYAEPLLGKLKAVEITHPAAILRAGEESQGFLQQKNEVVLADLKEYLEERYGNSYV